MFDSDETPFTVAADFDDALAARRQGAVVLAGGTWLMRDRLHGREPPAAIVTLGKIPALSEIGIHADRIVIGASLTHEALARGLSGLGGIEGVAAAAGGSANPAIRRVATLGGNLCTREFAAADLVPALLACDAMVELATAQGPLVLPLADFLKDRDKLLRDAILVRAILQRGIAGAHARLPLRKAGDYPVAIVSVVQSRDGTCRIAVGSVEPVARRWSALEDALARDTGGRLPDPARAAALADAHNDFVGRDGIEAEGWYRRQVLPALVRRAFAALYAEEIMA